ncbi:MAG: ankyrin repeat domain-containing protein [Legionella sp.]|nr:ankyrin repeat domain-containing protein [Legionella sp.]
MDKFHIPLKEPISPRYIHLNPLTNRVHLLVPLVRGQEIGTDNTCQRWAAINEFFAGKALQELNRYQEALIDDIKLFAENVPERAVKEDRLDQILIYIDAIEAMSKDYSGAVYDFLKKRSNLYGIQLRPRRQGNSMVFNPVFTVNREDGRGRKPLSALYNVMHKLFPALEIKSQDPRTQFIDVGVEALEEINTDEFEDIQHTLAEKMLALFGVNIDFTHDMDGTFVNKELVDALMGFEENASLRDYIESLIGLCARNVWEMLPTPCFSTVSKDFTVKEKTEALSMLTQFFLAILNVYCKAKAISSENFGTILDESDQLSEELITTVCVALSEGNDPGAVICDFINTQKETFKLNCALNNDHVIAIQNKFERTYRTITATKENPHMDEFLVLDLEAEGEESKVVTHQGSICVNFAEIIDPSIALLNLEYFNQIRTDFANPPKIIPHKNEGLMCEIELTKETILTDELLNHIFQLLHTACKEWKVDEFKAILTMENMNVNFAFTQGITPLMIATDAGQTYLVDWLLAMGAAVNQSNEDGMTALMIASQEGHVAIMKSLLDKWALTSLSMDNGVTALIGAASVGPLSSVKLLIEKGAPIDQATYQGTTALMMAAYKQRVEIVKWLIEQGASIEKAMSDGETALMMAVRVGAIEVVKLLVEKGASVNQAMNNGCSPIMMAARVGCIEIIKILLDAGALVNQATYYGGTPLFYAAKMGHLPIVKLLLLAGAKPDLPLVYTRQLLLDFFQGSTYSIQEKVELWMKEKRNQGLSMLPHEIAHIMGYEDISVWIKECMPLPCTISNNRYLFYKPSEAQRSVSLTETLKYP